MNKDDIKKALECCVNPSINPCKDCPYNKNGDFSYCNDKILKDTLNLITEQEKEIDGLKAEDERLREVIRQLNTEYNRAWERLKSDCREIGELKAENKQLKTECALLDDELRIARQETIDVLNKVKERAVGLAAIETYHICNLVDELLKEYE